MKLLITGGAGFIGSNFTRHILNKYPPYKIINLDKLTYAGNLDNLKGLENNPSYTFLKGDICNPSIVKKAMSGCDYVIHFAAETHVDRSIQDAFSFIETDVKGTFNLLEVARKLKIKKFIQISTDEIYGSIEKGSFKETDPTNPRNPYSATKLAGDRLAYSYFITHNLPVIITRSSNNFGPYQHPEKLISLFVTNLLEGKKVPLYGDGLNVRDWIYVLDNCEAIDFILHNAGLGEVYNIAGNNEKTNLEITELILKFLNKDKTSIEYVQDRSGHDRRYSLNSNKLRKLGWQPKFDFESALKETIKWYKTHEDWWKKLKSN